MDTYQINSYMKKFKKFYGALCRDQLPEKINTPLGLIVNTDACSEPGQHWVAIYLDKNGKGEYFDPFGLPPLHNDFVNFMNKNCYNGWYYNETTLQSISSSTCGHYCILYIATKLTGKEFYSLFTNKSHINDILVKEYLNNA